MIESGLAAFLLGDNRVASLTGGRIYPDKAPQRRPGLPPAASFPRIVYQRIGTPRRVRSNSGPAGLCSARVQLGCDGLTRADAITLADACRRAVGPVANGRTLDGYQGLMGIWTVQSAWVEEDVAVYFAPAHGDDVGVYRTSVDVLIWFNEAIQ